MKKNVKAISLALLLVMLIGALASVGCNGRKPIAEYTVSFYEEDGTTLIESRVFNEGASMSYPEREKEGYYPNWEFYDLEGNPVNYNGYVLCDMKLVLCFQPKDCQVVLIDQATGETVYCQYHSWGDVYVPEEAPEHEGYVFKGFAESNETEEFKTEFLIKDSCTIYAVYEALVYTVKYIDGIDHGTLAEIKVNYGDLTLPGVPAKEGYKLEGWYVVEGGQKVRIGGMGDTYQITKDVTLFAEYVEVSDK